jgi:hypothetical protein
MRLHLPSVNATRSPVQLLCYELTNLMIFLCRIICNYRIFSKDHHCHNDISFVFCGCDKSRQFIDGQDLVKVKVAKKKTVFISLNLIFDDLN